MKLFFQRHDSKMDGHVCDICGKPFSLSCNLKRHKEQVHEKRKNHQCGICGKEFARKQHKELHLKTCSRQVQGGDIDRKKFTSAKKLEFSPQLRIATFGGIIADWIIKVPADYNLVDPIVLLKEAMKSMKLIITKHLRDHTKRLKYTVSGFVVFHHGCDPEVTSEPPVVLTTDFVSVYLPTDLDHSLEESAEELMELVENYEGVGSGWVFDHFQRIDFNLISF